MLVAASTAPTVTDSSSRSTSSSICDPVVLNITHEQSRARADLEIVMEEAILKSWQAKISEHN